MMAHVGRTCCEFSDRANLCVCFLVLCVVRNFVVIESELGLVKNVWDIRELSWVITYPTMTGLYTIGVNYEKGRYSAQNFT
jgi:hypothetical protein